MDELEETGAGGGIWRPDRGTVVNESDLPDEVVVEAVHTYIEEHASVLGVNAGSTFQTYANQGGGLLARPKFRTPGNIIDEIRLSRDLAERDDDVGATIGMMQAVAFGEGMQHTHPDEIAVAAFDEMGKDAGFDMLWKELYREWLIAGGITTASLFTRKSFQFTPDGADRQRTRSMIVPRIGIFPAEQIRVVGSDMFGEGILAYRPSTGAQEAWLREYFSPQTSPAKKAAMRSQDPVLTTLLIEELSEEDQFPAAYDPDELDVADGTKLYRLNPRLVHRSTIPKGSWKYPRPLMTRNFALLEAKRLLNLMDYALLQGGSNFLVVAKKGSDQRPALPEEVNNLREVVKRASRTGVIIGDHRLDIEIITPDLAELLDAKKRNLLGRKLGNALLRVPEANEDAGGEGMKARMQLISRIITSDRLDLKRHVTNNTYPEVVKRNSNLPDKPASVWFPKIILEGGQHFSDYVMKMRDRGDISRKSAVMVGGFDYEHEVQQRKREKPDDRIMTPAEVPFSSPNAGPQDTPAGRPVGSGPNNGRAGASRSTAPARARPSRVIQRTAGETVRAMYEEEVGTYRVGEQTYAILEEYADTKKVGRMTRFELDSLRRIEDGDLEAVFHEGSLAVVPVNPEYELAEFKAVRLADGISMIVGTRDDGALCARALCFKEPMYDALSAQETALRWGFDIEPYRQPEPEPEPEPEPAS